MYGRNQAFQLKNSYSLIEKQWVCNITYKNDFQIHTAAQKPYKH